MRRFGALLAVAIFARAGAAATARTSTAFVHRRTSVAPRQNPHEPTGLGFARPSSQRNHARSKVTTHLRAVVPDADAAAADNIGELQRLKQEERRLSSALADVRERKLGVLRSRPLSVGLVGFGRFGRFVAERFVGNSGGAEEWRVVATSRSDHSAVAAEMGVDFVPYDEMERFVCEEGLDVIILAVSILSFEETVATIVPHLRKRSQDLRDDDSNISSLPLIVELCSVKEHPRRVLLDSLPKECDVLCTHPMFGPDSAAASWRGRTFVYERTRIDGVLLEEDGKTSDELLVRDLREDSYAHTEGVDRMERFLSIFEEEGCNMVPLSCALHDDYAANSQFVTHLVGRILSAQRGLKATPIDTRGFQSMLNLVENTNADSFDLFYGLYKFNRNSRRTIRNLREALEDVVEELMQRDDAEFERKALGGNGGGGSTSLRAATSFDEKYARAKLKLSERVLDDAEDFLPEEEEEPYEPEPVEPSRVKPTSSSYNARASSVETPTDRALSNPNYGGALRRFERPRSQGLGRPRDPVVVQDYADEEHFGHNGGNFADGSVRNFKSNPRQLGKNERENSTKGVVGVRRVASQSEPQSRAQNEIPEPTTYAEIPQGTIDDTSSPPEDEAMRAIMERIQLLEGDLEQQKSRTEAAKTELSDFRAEKNVSEEKAAVENQGIVKGNASGTRKSSNAGVPLGIRFTKKRSEKDGFMARDGTGPWLKVSDSRKDYGGHFVNQETGETRLPGQIDIPEESWISGKKEIRKPNNSP